MGELEHDVAGVVDTEVVPPAPDHVLDTGTLYSWGTAHCTVLYCAVLYCTVLYCAVLQLVLPCSIHLVHCSDVQIVTSARDIHCHVLHHAVACLSSLHAFFLYIDFLANSL